MKQLSPNNQRLSVLSERLPADVLGTGIARPDPETYGSRTRPLPDTSRLEAEEFLLPADPAGGGREGPSQASHPTLSVLRRDGRYRPEHAPTEDVAPEPDPSRWFVLANIAVWLSWLGFWLPIVALAWWLS